MPTKQLSKKNKSDADRNEFSYGGYNYYNSKDETPFREGKILGKGVYSEVVVVRNKAVKSGDAYALKKTMLNPENHLSSSKTESTFRKEAKILKILNHSHIVKTQGLIACADYIGILLEPIADCNLLDVLLNVKSKTVLKLDKPELLLSLSGCLINAVSYIHEQNVIHHDISARNIFIMSNGEGPVPFTCVLGDFCSSADISPDNRTKTIPRHGPGEKRYCSPEGFDHSSSGTKSDIFSLGSVLLEIITFAAGKKVSDLHDICSSKGHGFYSDCLPSLNDWAVTLWNDSLDNHKKFSSLNLLAMDMMSEKPFDRPSAIEVLEEIRTFPSPEALYGCDHCFFSHN